MRVNPPGGQEASGISEPGIPGILERLHRYGIRPGVKVVGGLAGRTKPQAQIEHQRDERNQGNQAHDGPEAFIEKEMLEFSHGFMAGQMDVMPPVFDVCYMVHFLPPFRKTGAICYVNL